MTSSICFGEQAKLIISWLGSFHLSEGNCIFRLPFLSLENSLNEK